MTGPSTSERLLGRLLVVLLAWVLTATGQAWVGQLSIYSNAYEEGRLIAHEALLRNEVPPGVEWRLLGVETDNIRVIPVFLAQFIADHTPLGVNSAYRVLNGICLFAAILALFAYLRRWFPDVYCLLGVLYLGCILPLTYVLHYFHPWDRMGLLAWLVLLTLLRANRIVLFALVLVMAMAIKWDVLLLPALHGLVYIKREDWKRPALITALLFALTFGTMYTLQWLRPQGFNPDFASAGAWILPRAQANLRFMLRTHLLWPPLLTFLLPLLLAIPGWRPSDRFARAALVFGCALFVPLFLFGVFQEVRAHMPVLVLILPAALAGARRLLESPAAGTDGATSPHGVRS